MAAGGKELQITQDYSALHALLAPLNDLLAAGLLLFHALLAADMLY